ncbi:uncharacterized protein LOC129758494 [Uranotaenia lowii]|uniref:uncharacterized protein LOC129758494 n=1 Tax=Uranotaenia lowii TaxID=190385 RepID=UPI00247954AA|nr:uncharacterized protein LOC129758494 [Uranotaenia lowii]
MLPDVLKMLASVEGNALPAQSILQKLRATQTGKSCSPEELQSKLSNCLTEANGMGLISRSASGVVKMLISLEPKETRHFESQLRMLKSELREVATHGNVPSDRPVARRGRPASDTRRGRTIAVDPRKGRADSRRRNRSRSRSAKRPRM